MIFYYVPECKRFVIISFVQFLNKFEFHKEEKEALK